VKGPFVATHSNARTLCGEARNLTDDQIREIAGRGGVVGVNFYPGFLRKRGRGTVEDVVDHIDHLVQIGGIDAVGIGSDFDGIPRAPRGIEHAGEMGNLAASMRKRGYRSGEMKKILEGNFLRVFREVVG
jgi:membrane dipeptidase